ncbi:MAG: MBL fold metallo-hydrolase [Anaerolineae bacterium]|nr:MBL fold metallo-hydrolase [Anaerolineae bacterium]
MKVRFLGSGDTFGSGGRLQACIHVVAGETEFLLDCGTSALIGLKRWKVNPTQVGIILITHLHGDHFGGIPFFLLDAQLISKRCQPLVLAGPPGLERRVREAQEVLFPGSSQVEQQFSTTYVEFVHGKPVEIGPLVITPYQVVHASGAPPFALRIECGGRVLAYSGDTEWTESLVSAAKGAHLFICEAYFFEKKMKYHLDYQTLLAHRAALECERIVITHMSDDMFNRLASLEFEYAEDGKQIIV